jgi:hypothetical protein
MINQSNSYYFVDGLGFESKIQACLFAAKVNKKVTWDFNRKFFDTYDWSKEPNKTLDQLYNERAKQLREKYDYLILSYSGGADSHNILMSFVRQGLHIDELMINHMSDAWKKFVVLDPNQKASWNTGAEHDLHTIPILKKIQPLIPNTKITVLDLSQNLFDTFLDAGDASWVLERTEGLNPLNVTRFNYNYFDEVRKRFDKNHKIAMLVGVDKPRVLVKDNNVYTMFNDRAVNIVPVHHHFEEYTNSNLEFFYWSTDAVDLLCKQAHVVKRFIENNPQFVKLWTWDDDYLSNFRLHHEKMLRSIIYTTWDQNWFQTDKAIYDWSSEFDDWFTHGYQDHKAHAIWKEGLKHIMTNVPDFLKYRDDGTPDGLKGFLQPHLVGKLFTNLAP